MRFKIIDAKRSGYPSCIKSSFVLPLLVMFSAVAMMKITKTYGQEGVITPSVNSNAVTESNTETLPPRRLGFDQLPFYGGDDLGATYTPQATTFKVWSPTAQSVKIQLFHSGEQAPHAQIEMTKAESGTWTGKVKNDLHGIEYLFQIEHHNLETGEAHKVLVADPYARACTANSERSVIADLSRSDPSDWNSDRFVTLSQNTDALLYELHLRDFTIHPSSGAPDEKRGKYLGAIEPGTVNDTGLSTGIDHLCELGVTHIHLLPIHDYPFGDETQTADDYDWYDWGYGTMFFQTPEGSYASSPHDFSRQKELKQLIQTCHNRNLGVVLDVVFNHTAATGTNPGSIFDRVTPYHFYRFNEDGSYSGFSGCGNDLATERPMVRKFIVDTIQFWMREYHVDGFRFDLMGLIDRKTMREVYREAKKINPSVLIYGEGWSMEGNLPAEQMMTQANVSGTNIAAFNDGTRDTVKGPVWDPEAPGFVQTGTPRNGVEEFMGNLKGQITANGIPVANPTETIQYVSAHDDHCLWDKIQLSTPQRSREDREQMDRLAAGIVLTSQGIPFLHAGDEFLRSKNGVKNSYNSNAPNVNPIRWDLKTENFSTYQYYRGLIHLRKKHPAFRMTTKQEVDRHFQPLTTQHEGVYAYRLHGAANDDQWDEIVVILNGSRNPIKLPLPGTWKIVVNQEKAGTETVETQRGHITSAPISITVAHRSSP